MSLISGTNWVDMVVHANNGWVAQRVAELVSFSRVASLRRLSGLRFARSEVGHEMIHCQLLFPQTSRLEYFPGDRFGRLMLRTPDS